MITNREVARGWGKVLLAITLAAVLGSAAEASAQTPPTLLSEQFHAAPEEEELLDTKIDFQTQCSTTELGAGTVTFTATGIAVGPYTGTFIESGYFTVANFQVTDFRSTFTIYSPTGERTVSGSKTLLSPSPFATFGYCFSSGASESMHATVSLSYEARIGSFTDRGEAQVYTQSQQVQGQPTGVRYFHEFFYATEGLIPDATLGKVTGGGQILHPPGVASNSGVTFGFVALNTDQGMTGSGVVIDHATNTKIRILDVTRVAVAGTHATFSGRAEVNGVEEEYRIDVDDLGERGVPGDTFKIQTDSYTNAGPLTGGNIQIHKKPEPAATP